MSKSDRISDVMAGAADNPFLYELLIGDVDLRTLELDEERIAACRAAREHIHTQRFSLLRVCSETFYGEMSGTPIQPKQLRLVDFPHFFIPWAPPTVPGGPPTDIAFWVWHGDEVVKTYQHVPLLVTFSTDTKGRNLDRVADALRVWTGQKPVMLNLWRPRLVWRAVKLTAEPFNVIAKRAVKDLRDFYLNSTGASGGAG